MTEWLLLSFGLSHYNGSIFWECIRGSLTQVTNSMTYPPKLV